MFSELTLIVPIFFSILGLLILFAKKPSYALYALSFVSSLIAFNINIGFTFYLTRVILALFLLSRLLRHSLLAGEAFSLDSGVVNKQELLPSIVILFFQLLWQLISLVGSYSIADGVNRILIYFILMVEYSFISLFPFDKYELRKALLIFISMGAFQGLFGLYQLIGYPLGWTMLLSSLDFIPAANPLHRQDAIVDESGTLRAFGTLGDPNIYAAFLVMVILIQFVWLLQGKGKDKFKNVFVLIITVLSIAGLVISGSRSAIISLSFGVFILLFNLKNLSVSIKQILIKKLVPLALLFFVSINILTASFDSLGSLSDTSSNNPVESVLSRMSQITNLFSDLDSKTNKSQSLDEHVFTRTLGLEIFAHYPVKGIGIGNFRNYYSTELHAQSIHSHSHHIDTLAETGIIGFAIEWLFVFRVISIIRKGILMADEESEDKIWLIGILCSLLSAVAGNFNYFYYLNDFIWFEMAIGVSLSNEIIKSKKAKHV